MLSGSSCATDLSVLFPRFHHMTATSARLNSRTLIGTL